MSEPDPWFHDGGTCRKPGNSPRQYYLDRVLRVFLSLVRANCAACGCNPNRAPLFLICFPLNHRFLGIRKLSRPALDILCHRCARVETGNRAPATPPVWQNGRQSGAGGRPGQKPVQGACSGCVLRKPADRTRAGIPRRNPAYEALFKLNLRRARDHGARLPVLRSSRCRALRSRDGGHFAFRNPA